MVIWKYKLGLSPVVNIAIPKYAKFLDVRVQRGEICVWYLLDPDQEKKVKTFAVRETGAMYGSDFTMGKYLGTFQLGGYVGHVFEV